MMTTTNTATSGQLPAFSALPLRMVNCLVPSTVEAGITGCERLTQNRKGLVTIFWQNQTKETIPMCDYDIVQEPAGFMQAFRRAWMRKETGK